MQLPGLGSVGASHQVRRLQAGCRGRAIKQAREAVVGLRTSLKTHHITHCHMPYYSQRCEAGIDITMVRLLLHRSTDPNQQVHLNDGKSVWALLLLSCHEATQRGEVASATRHVWYQVAELWIRHGANARCRLELPE